MKTIYPKVEINLIKIRYFPFILIVLMSICGCGKENYIFENCIFPFEETDIYNDEAIAIIETELPLEITEDLRSSFDDVIEIEAFVINNCLRENFLIVNIIRRIYILGRNINGNTTELESEDNSIIMYDSCGELLGSIEDEKNSEAIELLESELKDMIDLENKRIGDIIRLDFEDGSKDFIVEISLKEVNSNLRTIEIYFFNLEESRLCLVDM